MKSQIKHQFAKNETHQIIDIEDTIKYESYYCLGCGERVIPVKGTQKQHHFRHFKIDCNNESYYHIAGKAVFEYVWSKRTRDRQPIPLTLSRVVKCNKESCIDILGKENTCKNLQQAVYNLTNLFCNYVVEQRDKDTNLIPDILLFNNKGHKCYIEICNTHSCTQEKIDTNIPIIEIKSSCESDLKYIMNGFFNHDDCNIKLFNFKVSSRDSSDMEHCSNKTKIITITIGTDHRLNYKYTSLCERKETIHSVSFIDTTLPVIQLQKIQSFLSDNVSDPIGYRNCFRCQHVKDWKKGKVYCSFNRHYIPDYFGAMCNNFKVGN
ncbi:competence protein CoiA family protein [Photobacterium leiognathi]|uniref:competence protein CoiA family protein n=1 Tax=Photobacterium leiognathi TaxID=553611 RepID=UPI002980E9C1|nr:competence protein CoiA family protein [Photobacterium leiognathi]